MTETTLTDYEEGVCFDEDDPDFAPPSNTAGNITVVQRLVNNNVVDGEYILRSLIVLVYNGLRPSSFVSDMHGYALTLGAR